MLPFGIMIKDLVTAFLVAFAAVTASDLLSRIWNYFEPREPFRLGADGSAACAAGESAHCAEAGHQRRSVTARKLHELLDLRFLRLTLEKLERRIRREARHGNPPASTSEQPRLQVRSPSHSTFRRAVRLTDAMRDWASVKSITVDRSQSPASETSSPRPSRIASRGGRARPGFKSVGIGRVIGKSQPIIRRLRVVGWPPSHYDYLMVACFGMLVRNRAWPPRRSRAAP